METTTMPPSFITAGQIGRVADRFSERCRINALSLPRDSVQAVLENEGDVLAQEMFEIFRSRVERRTNLIVCRVFVNRTRTFQEMLNATGRKQYTNNNVVKTMPQGEGDEVEVVFFRLGRYISDDDLEKEYELRGLKPADPYSQAAVSEADPAFADEHPNSTHWKDSSGNWCFSAFRQWSGVRGVYIFPRNDGWTDVRWWFAGLRKK